MPYSQQVRAAAEHAVRAEPTGVVDVAVGRPDLGWRPFSQGDDVDVIRVR